MLYQDLFSFILINLGFQFLDIINTFMIIIGIIIGIICLDKKESVDILNHDSRSGKGELSEIPSEIKGWNWGAFGLTWLWGLFHGVYLALLCFIPLVGIVLMFVLGAKGNEWAWQAKPWQSVEDFKNAQKKWQPWGIIFFVLGVILFIRQFFLLLLE